MSQVSATLEKLTWPNLGEAPEKPGVYAWYVRLVLGEADLTEFESSVMKEQSSGGRPAYIVEDMLTRHFFHPFRETPYTVNLTGPLKPRYAGELKHEPAASAGLVDRLIDDPSRLRPLAHVLGAAAPYFTAPLYIGMASNLRGRLQQHKDRIIRFTNNPGSLHNEESASGFAEQVVQRNFNPTQLFVQYLVVDNINADEQVDLENILNRINFPIFGRN